MVEVPTGIISGLKITNYYKYILYVAGVILILSLFFDAQGVDNERLRNIAFWVVVVGLGIWLLDDILQIIEEGMANSPKFTHDEFELYDWTIFVLFLIFQIGCWAFLLSEIALSL